MALRRGAGGHVGPSLDSLSFLLPRLSQSHPDVAAVILACREVTGFPADRKSFDGTDPVAEMIVYLSGAMQAFERLRLETLSVVRSCEERAIPVPMATTRALGDLLEVDAVLIQALRMAGDLYSDVWSKPLGFGVSGRPRKTSVEAHRVPSDVGAGPNPEEVSPTSTPPAELETPATAPSK